MTSARVLFGLQTKLVVAFVLIVLLALGMAGTVFVAVQRGDAEDHALDHVVAASPPVYTEFTFLQRSGESADSLADFVDNAASQQELHILLVDRTDGTITHDTQDALTGKKLTLPRNLQVASGGRLQPYVSWHPQDGSPGDNLMLITALPSSRGRVAVLPPVDEQPYWILLAISKSTIAGAWRGLLPQLLIAAAIAVPIAVVIALILANYISRPLAKLTTASQLVAEGNYDVRVDIDRRDEVGRLAKSFSTMAERVGEAHSQMRALIANVSHDLKTPLTSILGFSQALRDGGTIDDEQTRHMGDVIHNEALRLSSRLNDLLYLAEIESGQSVLQRDDIDLRRLVETSVQRIEDDVKKRGVDLNVQLADATISADGAKLERAVENLLDNARKYTPGGGEIDVRLAPNGSAVTIEIANTARDVTEDELPRLFERFYRRERSRSENGARSGSGLGLAIARDLVELHGGELSAGLNNGLLEFTMKLPRSAAPAQAPLASNGQRR